jgi:serine/threonine-protein kinase HipA
MTQQKKTIYVYSNTRPMGTLYAELIRGRELFSFEYEPDWLSPDNPLNIVPLDPDLALYSGRQYAPPEKQLFGIFTDSCPDRWGRLLMKRREAVTARKEGRKPDTLTESDFLLGVQDAARMGALRFKLEKDGPFLASGTELATPPWTTLRELEHASYSFETDDVTTDEKWLKELLAPGSSLGGARPKASVLAPDGTLWIAKFPSKHDEYDSGAWEKVVHDLARLCALDVPESKLETLSRNGSTFLVKRFDRTGDSRIHFCSAMTLLGKTDGASAEDGTGYLDIASFIRSSGDAPKKDLRELWKRIVFNIAVSNTDDHLRNHGFLLGKNGWRLSPLYDVNPVPYGNTLSLTISEIDNTSSIGLALETAPYYGLTAKEARQEADSICQTVHGNWRRLAGQYGISYSAAEYMSPAFAAADTAVHTEKW